MSVIVLNPNLNRVAGQIIPYSPSMESHSLFVWEKYISTSRFKKLFIVAHSAGGACLAAIQRKNADEFYERVAKVALTDSWTIEKGSLNQS